MKYVARLNDVLTGSVVPLPGCGRISGIHKTPRSGQVVVTKCGLSGDQQADSKHHGGPEKAIHHYPYEHYDLWRRDLDPVPAVLSSAGAFGENFSTTGLTESNVCIGDVFQVGTAVVQVSQGRQPCWKLNCRFGVDDMALRVQISGRTGWYYRVLEEGEVWAGCELVLKERCHGGWSLARIVEVFYRTPKNWRLLEEITQLEALAASWRQLAARRLSKREVESWDRRLESPVDE